jgi:hypothetical protein
MDDLKMLLNQLDQIGSKSEVQVRIAIDGDDLEAVSALLQKLSQAGIAPQVHVDINFFESAGEETEAQEAGQGEPKEDGTPVIVTRNKLNCRIFERKDKAGKPIMEIHEPRVQVFSGERLLVSTTHQAGEKDAGDGVVIATGGQKYFFVVDCPSNRQAEGLYVRAADVAAA